MSKFARHFCFDSTQFFTWIFTGKFVFSAYLAISRLGVDIDTKVINQVFLQKFLQAEMAYMPIMGVLLVPGQFSLGDLDTFRIYSLDIQLVLILFYMSSGDSVLVLIIDKDTAITNIGTAALLIQTMYG